MAGRRSPTSLHRLHQIRSLERGESVTDVRHPADLDEPPTAHRAHEAFSAFYRAEADGQVRRAALLLGSSAIANDVVHDAFVQVFRRWGHIDAPGPYLNRAVLNGCRDVARRSVRDRGIAHRFGAGTDDSPPHESLADALARLPFNQRAAIVLRFYVGLSVAEIAASLDCRPGTVGPWITRGLRQLRQEITP
jgi:RNA polymerase sigma factor (sigma-70 family)